MFRSPKDALTIEDCLELVAGISQLKFHENPDLNKLQNFKLHEDNHKIMFSIAKQVFKGTALTERQYTLVQKLLVEYYTKQFTAHEIDLKDCLKRLRHPLRKINDEHWIKLREYKTMQMLVIRFPFNAQRALDWLDDRGINGGFVLSEWYSNCDSDLLVCATDQTTLIEIEIFVQSLKTLMLEVKK